MTTEKKCLKCQARLPADAPEGLCPACLFQQAMETMPDKTLRIAKEMATQTIRSHVVPPEVPGKPPVKLRRVGAAGSPDAECDFQLLSMLGQGGMGLVYQARQTSISRSIALKMMRSDKSDDQDRQALFLAEALVTGQLDHPNIVPIYDLGMDEAGHLFYAMKELKGRPWSDTIGHQTLQENLDILLRVGDAVAFAHSRGVIHRDLKPQNVMLGEYGEVVLMDWGLAAAITTGSPALRVSKSTALCGTPAYMAPEMAHGLWNRIGPQSDIYLLGAILFEILEGAPPHLMGREDPTDALTAARLNKIAAAKTPGELQDIARKAMATEPADRYASVKDFQAAIRVFREHQESDRLAVLARQRFEAALASKCYDDYAESVFGYRQALRLWPDNQAAQNGLKEASLQYARTALDQGDLDLALSLLKEEDETQHKLAQKVRQRLEERTRQTARIRALRRSLAVAGSTLLVVAAASAIWINRERLRAIRGEEVAQQERLRAVRGEEVAQQERLRAIRGEEAAQTALAESRRLLSESLEAAATTKIEAGESAQALALLASALRQNPSNQIATARTLDLLNHGDWVLPARDGLDQEGSIHPSSPPAPFAQRLVAVTQQNQSEIVLRVIPTNSPFTPLGKSIGPFPSPATASSRSAVSPDGRILALAAGDRRLHLFDRFENKEMCPPISLLAQPASFSFSPAGESLMLGFRTGLYQFLDLRHPGAIHKSFFALEDSTGEFTSDKAYFALFTNSTPQFRMVDLRPGNACAIPIKTGSFMTSAAFTPDGNRVVLSTGSDGMSRFSAYTGVRLSGPIRLHGYVWVSAVSPDGRCFAAGTARGQVSLANPDTGEVIAQIDTLTNTIRALAFDAQGRYLAVGGDDRQILVLDAHSLATIASFPVERTVRSLAISPDLKYLLAGVDHDAFLWNLDQPDAPPKKLGTGGWVRDVDFSPDGKLGLWGEYHSAHLFQTDSTAEVAVVHGHADAIWRAEFSPDGTFFATVSYDGFLRLWSARDGAPLTSFLQINDGAAGGSSTLAFSSDSRWVAAGSDHGLVRIWDAATGREVITPLRLADGEISSLAFSADSKRLVAASRDGIATVVELVPNRETLPWLPELAEAVGGLHATESGFDPLAWSARQETLAALLKFTESSPSNSLAQDWLAWFLADRGTRRAGPWSTVTVPEVAARFRQSFWLSDRLEAVALEPNNPTSYVKVAELLLPLDTSRTAFWLALARDLDPAIELSPVMEAILATAPFDANTPPGPQVFPLDLENIQDFNSYVHKDVVLSGTVESFVRLDGHGRLLFKDVDPAFFGFIPDRCRGKIEETLGGKVSQVLIGQRIRLHGVLMPFENSWEIQILEPAQIEWLPPGSGEPAEAAPAFTRQSSPPDTPRLAPPVSPGLPQPDTAPRPRGPKPEPPAAPASPALPPSTAPARNAPSPSPDPPESRTAAQTPATRNPPSAPAPSAPGTGN